MTGTEALKLVRRLEKSGWTRVELAARLGLRSTDVFRKWDKSDPLVGTAKALARLKPKADRAHPAPKEGR